MREPYGLARARVVRRATTRAYRGFLTLTPQQIAAAIAIGHRLGWQMVAHVTGDAGVDVVLDAIEAAQKEQPAADRRHTRDPCDTSSTRRPRRGPRGCASSSTRSPRGTTRMPTRLSPALGRERLAHFIGLRTWRNAGVDVAINTDHMFGLDPERCDESVQSVSDDLRRHDAADRVGEGRQRRGSGLASRRRCG